MRFSQLLLVLLLAAGCDASEQSALDDEHASTLAVGQRWADAQALASRAGYQLHDAAGLAWQPTIDGYYISLAGDRDLIVFRNAFDDTVVGLTLVENASKPKSERALHSHESFKVPPATRSGG